MRDAGPKLTPEEKLIYDSVPPDPPRSRLEPHRSLILQWRRQGRTLKRIRDLVEEKFGVSVSVKMIQKFIAARNRPRVSEPEPEVIAAPEVEVAKPVEVERKRASEEERVAMRERARAAHHVSLYGPVEEPKKLFVFDPDRPLINKSYT